MTEPRKLAPRRYVGDRLTVGSTRWVIREINDQDVVLEATNASPGIIWRTTLDVLPEPTKEQS